METKKKGSMSSRVMGFVLNNKALMILVVLMVVAQIASHGLFLTYANLSSVSRQVAVSMLLGFGFTVVLASGGLDLSVSNMLSWHWRALRLLYKGHAAAPCARGGAFERCSAGRL